MMIKLILLSALATATYTDLNHHKIYNKLVYPLMFLGFIYQCYMGKTLIPVKALQGFVFPLVLLPFFAFNMIGAGDVKLFMAVGMWIGFGDIVNVMIYSILVGGVVALGLILIRKNGIKRLRYFGLYLKSCLIAFKPLPYQDFDDQHVDGRFPFGVAILMGYLIYFFKLSIS